MLAEMEKVRETYDRESGHSYGSFYKRQCSDDLLHNDDHGAEHRTDWVLEQLYAIVNERWQSERSIVVTSNLTNLDELREQVGARTVSRLAEICGDPVLVMGRDLRVARSTST